MFLFNCNCFVFGCAELIVGNYDMLLRIAKRVWKLLLSEELLVVNERAVQAAFALFAYLMTSISNHELKYVVACVTN
jgi:hypothetical protein